MADLLHALLMKSGLLVSKRLEIFCIYKARVLLKFRMKNLALSHNSQKTVEIYF